MSAYSETITQFTDAQLLIDALTQMGFTPSVNLTTPVELPARSGVERGSFCEIILPREQTKGYNAVGFKRGPDGKFSAVISDVDDGAYGGRPGSGRYGSEWLKKLRATYTECGVKRQANRAGLRMTGRKVNPDGKIVYQFLKR